MTAGGVIPRPEDRSCPEQHFVRDLDGTDTNGTLICSRPRGHGGMHNDASEGIWWQEDIPVPP